VTELQAAVMIAAFLLPSGGGAGGAPLLRAASQRASARAAALATGRDARTALKLWALLRTHGRIVLEQPSSRGTPRRPNEVELLALGPRVQQHVHEALLKGSVPCWVACRSLQGHFSDYTSTAPR
jgi:hypothetical protein